MPLPSSDTAPIEDGSLTKSDVLDLLNDETPDTKRETIDIEPDETIDEDTTPHRGKTKSGEPKSDEKIELAEEDEEPEEQVAKKFTEGESDLDLITPARRQDILKKYPTLFKDFPHLEKAYYRDQAYNELFSTPEEAREVVQNIKSYEQFSNKVFQGSTAEVLSTVKQNNPQAFGKIVDNYLVTLKNVDERAFYHVIGNTIKSTAASMAQEAQRIGNDDLLSAARLMYQYVMGTTDYTPPTSFNKNQAPERSEEQNEIQNERMQYFQERFESTQSDLQSRVDGVLKNTIDQNIDPKESMTPYVKRVAVKEVLDNVQKEIDSDPQFRKLLDRLWEKAAEDKFSKTSVEKIRSAYLSKAKTLLPANIKKSRNEALRGLGKRVREEYDDSEETTTRVSTAPKTRSSSNRNENPSKGKATLDFLNED